MAEAARCKFALVVHSTEVVRKVLECTKFLNETIHTRVISFDEGERVARELLDRGYEVILCHGGTGESILRAIGHSVVLIQKTDVDVIRTLSRARALASEVAITVHANEFRDLDFMQDILGMRIREIRYATKEELIDGVEEAYRQGIRCVIGGGVSRTSIEARGGRGLIIEPNTHSVLQAIQQARVMAQAKREESKNREQLIAILKLLGEGVVFIDTDKNVVFSNAKARQYLRLSRKAQAPDQLARHFGALFLDAVLADGQPRLNAVVTVDAAELVVNALPVSINSQLRGAVAMFRDTASIYDMSNLLHEELRQRGLTSSHTLADIKGESPAVARLAARIERFARTCSSILIHGETGVGKELVAHAVHERSARKDKAFVAINCSALPETLLESELFGYEEGAFTGARRGGKVGLFELANHGTIFLDEIGDVSHGLQLRLLRVLEAKELMRLGGNKIIPVDVRVISASHRDLMALAREGAFRMDLFFRLAVLRLQVPPLRQRLDDIPLLVADLLRRNGLGPGDLTPGMLAALRGYAWPGNIRELLSFFESYLALLDEKRVDEALFLELFQERAMPVPGGHDPEPADGTLKEQLRRCQERIVASTLEQSGRNKRLAAQRLGVSYNTLWRFLSGRDAPDREG